jgi:AmmeMemoRadiSam system protein B/AmmeMemoRadiSam system protein A
MNYWSKKDNTREAMFAGQFYSENKQELTNQLAALFDKAKSLVKSTEKKPVQALIVPHAGYVFSGEVAASAYLQIPDNAQYKRVFILASSHRYSYNGAAVYCSGNYKTPLGEIKVDTLLAKELLNSSEVFTEYNEAHENEHSLEVQLPFLQYILGPKFLLVPIILGANNTETCKKIAVELKPWFTPENLWIISTDFSHYPEYEDARKVDEITATAICSNQPEQLQSVLRENKSLKVNNLATSLCGWTSVFTLLYLTEHNEFAFKKILYQNSGDSMKFGSKNRVVGYWSIAVYGHNKNQFTILEEEKKELLKKARTSISTFVNTGEKGQLQPPESSGMLNEITGAFVSIYINGKLRGCIGGFAQKKTLNDLVQDMAVSASHDRRFDPVKPEELENMELEISVLSPLKKISSPAEIELSKHGIYIKDGLSSGTFLPQVATKTGWTIDEFLGHCSRDKAGIGWNGWKSAEIFTYEAIVFRDEQKTN